MGCRITLITEHNENPLFFQNTNVQASLKLLIQLFFIKVRAQNLLTDYMGDYLWKIQSN